MKELSSMVIEQQRFYTSNSAQELVWILAFKGRKGNGFF